VNAKCKNLDRQNYNSIDLFKLIGAFLVVSIHTNIFSSFSENFNWYFVNLFSRLAVYFFFVASSYFFFNGIKFSNGKIVKCKDNFNKLKKYFIRMSILYIVWSFIYMISDIPMWYEQNCLNFKNFKGFILNCVINTSHYHLWFVLSLVYAIPIMYFCLRFIKIRYLICFSIILYAIGLLYGAYSFVGLPFSDYWQLFSNKWPRLQTVIFYVIPICAFAVKCDNIKISQI
jgi:serine/alanine racemase